MAYSDCRVGVLQKVADGASHDIAASQYDGVLARDVDAGLLEQYHDTLGCAWGEERLAAALGQLTDALNAEAIDVLLVRDG